MKHIVTLCLMAWVGVTGLKAQVIELPTRNRKTTQTTQRRDTVKQDAQHARNEQPAKSTPASGGTMTLPTTRQHTTDAAPQPITAETTRQDSAMAVGKPLPVVRRQQAHRAKPIVSRPKVEDNEIYESAEKMPTYPGGAAELVKFINEHLDYPQQALADSAQGIVQVSFIVEKDGSATDFEVLDEHHPALEAEAVRVLQQMPRWKPATQRGVKVRVEYVVPVKFILPNQ